MLDLLLSGKRVTISAANAAAVLALVTPGTTVVGQGTQPIRAMLPSVRGVTYQMFGATILGSEALLVGSATLVSGTQYKIATSLHRPSTGGTTNAIYLYTNGVGYDGSTPTPISRNSTNSSTTGTNAWAMPGDGFLYFDLGRAVTANDVFEIPQRSCVFVAHSGMRILGGNYRHAEGYTISCGTTAPYIGLEIGYADIGWGSSDGINVNNGAGTCLGTYIHDCTIHDMQYDGGGGGDGISFENATPGATGSIIRCNFLRCGKTGLGNNDSNIVTYHDLFFDSCSIGIAGSGPQAGSHTFSRIRMINEWPQVATGIHGFFIFPGLNTSTVVNIDGLSIYRGTGSTTLLRAFRAQSGNVTIRNSVVSSFGAAVQFGRSFEQEASSAGTFTESNCAAGGAVADFVGWPTPTNDITLAATPFNNAATGDLTPNALIAGKGLGGVDIGYTSTPA